MKRTIRCIICTAVLITVTLCIYMTPKLWDMSFLVTKTTSNAELISRPHTSRKRIFKMLNSANTSLTYYPMITSDNTTCPVKFSQKTLPTVALAGPPNAGNMWVRHLLQQATGIYTGSVFHDQQLYNLGFLGEYEKPDCGKIIATAIHSPVSDVNAMFTSAIILLRNLFDLCLEEVHQRLKTPGNDTDENHVVHIGKTFIKNRIRQLYHWSCFWLKGYHGPILIVHYEDLVNDTKGEVTRMLDFLNVSMADRRMDCIYTNTENSRQRVQNNSDDYEIFYGLKEYITDKTQFLCDLLTEKGFKPMIPVSLPFN